MPEHRAPSHQTKGVIYMFGAYTAWGLLPIYWKALHSIPAKEILAHRILWSFVFVLLLLLFTRKWKALGPVLKDRSKLGGILLSSLLITTNWYIYIWAVNSNHVVEASLGYYINPLLTVLLGLIVLHERLDRWQALSIGLAAVGVLVITVEYGKVPWIALSLALTFALYGLAKRLVQVDSQTGLALETLVMVPVALLYLMLSQGQSLVAFGEMSLSIKIILIGTGIVTAIPLIWFAQGAKTVPFATMGFIQYVSPTLSLILGVLVYKEAFTRTYLLSFTLIWMAVAVYSLSRLLLSKAAKLEPSLKTHPLNGK